MQFINSQDNATEHNEKEILCPWVSPLTSSAQYGDDTAVGPNDVVAEKSKGFRSHGTKRKGLNLFLVSSSVFICDLIPISPHIGTLGMSAQRKRDIRQKSLEAGHTKP